ncbi:AraC family transcriptional regulator [Thalassobacillus pellis]|uniref:AraC family transcriptional regulator n=1 Tax=Thalassobacillus pellis TaxID=748008 RepID=UPI001960D587|nr:AraC family transcriptional regulator [Thalassobacillus pellis]MBM7552144.1 AraC-like DNA-binding protein [Thalassobacillus pellis]
MYVEHLRLQRSFAFCRVWGSHEEHDLHIHDCLEIGILLKNDLEYRFGDQTYEGKPGDIFLCRPFVPHWSYAQKDQPFECILLLFTPGILRKIPDGSKLLAPFYERNLPCRIPFDSSHAKHIKTSAEKAMEAQESGEEAWVTRQFMSFIDILLHVHDFVRKQAACRPGQSSTAIAEMVGHMLDNYQKPVDLETAASLIGLSRTAFYKEFGMLTGLTPNEFLNRLRVQHAMDLLRSTAENMTDIAYESGFQSLSTFNKRFKKYTGVSPREYLLKSYHPRRQEDGRDGPATAPRGKARSKYPDG